MTQHGQRTDVGPADGGRRARHPTRGERGVQMADEPGAGGAGRERGAEERGGGTPTAGLRVLQQAVGPVVGQLQPGLVRLAL